MKPVVQYILEMLFCSGIFLSLYSILPKKAGNFRSLRAFIIICTALSALVPFVEIPVWPAQTVVVTGYDAPIAELSGSMDAVPLAATDVAGKDYGIGKVLAAAVYILVVSALTGAVCHRLYRIWQLRRRSQVMQVFRRGKSYYIAQSPETESPFSFCRTIYIGSTIEAGEKDMVIAHESSHIRHRHSQERLFMVAMRTLLWFNPFVWILGKKLEEIHEFEADRDVLSEGYDARLYRLTIFKQLFGYYPEISCGLKNSLTKRRFIMMTETKKTRFAALRWASAMVLAGAAAFLASAGEVKHSSAAEPYADDVSLKSAADTLVIEISDRGRSIVLNGNVSAGMEALAGDFSAIKADVAIIRADDDTPMGVIADVKDALREIKVLKVLYAGSEYDEDAVSGYLPPSQSDAENIVGTETIVQSVGKDRLITVRLLKGGKILVDYCDKFKSADLGTGFAGVIAGIIKSRPDVLINIVTGDKTGYDSYKYAVEQIHNAYEIARDDYALSRFAKPLAQLTEEELRIVRAQVPMQVCESYAKNSR